METFTLRYVIMDYALCLLSKNIYQPHYPGLFFLAVPICVLLTCCQRGLMKEDLGSKS